MSFTGSVAAAAAQLTAPVAVALEGPDQFSSFLRELGYDVQLEAEHFTVVAGILDIVDDLTDLAEIAETLGEDTDAPAELTATAITLTRAVLDAIETLAQLTPASVASLVEPLDDPATWRDIAAALPGHLLVSWLRLEHPLMSALLVLGGVVVERDADAGAPAPRYELDWSAIGPLLSDPARHLTEVYRWGGPFEHERLLSAIGGVLNAAGIPSTSVDPAASLDDTWWAGERPAAVRGLRATVLEETSGSVAPLTLGVVALPVPAEGAGPDPERLLLTHEVATRSGAGTFQLGGGWQLRLDGAADTTAGLGVVIGADGTELAGPTASTGAGFAVTAEPETPWLLLGGPTGARVELRDATFEVSVLGSGAQPELVVTAGSPQGLTLVVDSADADSFVAELLGANPIEVAVGLLLVWSSEHGLTLGGQVGFSVTIPIDRTLGPITIDELHAGVSGGTEGGSVTVSVTGSAQLGPVTAVADGVGVALGLASAEDGSGNLGAADLTLAFKPPEGIGLALDVGVASGGGYLDIDAEAGSYSGVIDLDVLGVGICAVVIIDTNALESGEWSLFFALFIDVPAIQLGFGFTLTGVGGLFGFNRILERPALESAVRSGSLDAVLFPPDPIGDAPAVIAELSALFPPEDGSYVFGPVVRIGWGTPALIEAELGIVLSLPDPIVIAVLGSVTSVLPTQDLDLVALHLDVGGVVDATAGTLSIDASLHDSHVVGFALAGDMAVRAAFLEQPSFLMALGGFHPGFEEPDGFPSLRRLSLGLSAAPVLDISFECYVAITSNSVQFGSEFHLSAEIAGFGIEGGASFDALVEFSPFLVATRLGWYVAVTAVGIDLAGVWLDASVEGPNPWLVVGTARFKILGFEEEVRIDERIGDREPEPAVEAEELLDTLVNELTDEGAWGVVAGTSPGVVVSTGPPLDDELVALPDGMLTVSQRAVPLGLALDKAGDAPLDDHDTFEIDATGSLTSTGSVRDWFAPGYFFELGAGERLSAPSFERLEAGIEFGGGDVVAGTARTGTLDFEEILRDPELGEDGTPPHVVALDGRADLLLTMAGARTPGAFDIAADPALVSVAPTAYAVTDRETGQVVARTSTWSAAHQSVAGQRASTTIGPGWEAPR